MLSLCGHTNDDEGQSFPIRIDMTRSDTTGTKESLNVLVNLTTNCFRTCTKGKTRRLYQCRNLFNEGYYRLTYNTDDRSESLLDVKNLISGIDCASIPGFTFLSMASIIVTIALFIDAANQLNLFDAIKQLNCCRTPAPTG